MAQEPAPRTDALPTIVVSPTTLPTPEAQVASSVTVVTAADIEREQRRTVVDVLMNVPGLNVVPLGGRDGRVDVGHGGHRTSRTPTATGGRRRQPPLRRQPGGGAPSPAIGCATP